MVATQGSLDALCGVYTVINSLGLLRGGFHNGEERLLFEQLIDFINLDNDLDISTIITNGLYQKNLIKLLKKAFELCKKQDTPDQLNIKVLGNNNIGFQEYCSHVKAHLQTIPHIGQNVVIIGNELHWSCICKCTDKSFILADSDNTKSIKYSDCILKAETKSAAERHKLKKHILWPTQTFLLSVSNY